jgi:hypothetical protein
MLLILPVAEASKMVRATVLSARKEDVYQTRVSVELAFHFFPVPFFDRVKKIYTHVLREQSLANAELDSI